MGVLSRLCWRGMPRPVLGVLVLLFSCSRSELTVETRCGNGLVEDREACDDGNDIDHDACDNACRDRICGNGRLDPGEQCDLGADNEDRPALLLTHGELDRPVMPVDRDLDVVSFYSYTSESSHTGFERATASMLFLYRNVVTERLGLVTHHGIDFDSSGLVLEHGQLDMDLVGVPEAAVIAIGDEGDELSRQNDGDVVGRFEFWRNTDGGAIDGLPFPGNWRIEITVELRDGITSWSYVLDDEAEVSLDSAEVAVLTAFDTPSACRTDCQIPRCGDRFVDGGEVCDDGNARGGDGCAADCASLD